MTYDLTTDRDTKRVTETPSKSEIEKLEDMIRKQHPEWNITVEPFFEGYKLLLRLNDENVCTAVCHYYSYGGTRGLLEFEDLSRETDLVGWLSAEEALVLFEEAMARMDKSNVVDSRNFCRESLEAVMNAAGIPEGLQMKVLKIEGMDTESCSEALEENR